jgi:hypothetical protein
MPEPRNWKWILPAMSVPVWIVVFVLMVTAPMWELQLASLIPLVCIYVFLMAAVKNYKAYFSASETDNRVALLQAEYRTPEVRLFESMQAMHPETARLALSHLLNTYTIQDQDYDIDKFLDLVPKGAPAVHLGFMLFFLRNSTETQCMSKRLLSEGSKKFDPTGVTLDRDQYDALVDLLQKKMIVTRPYGESQPPLWIANCSPEVAAKKLGIWPFYRDDEDDLLPEKRTVGR